MLRKKLTLARWFSLLLCILALLAGESSRLGDAKTPLHFAVIGDTGTGEEPQYAIARRLVVEREKTVDLDLLRGRVVRTKQRAG